MTFKKVFWIAVAAAVCVGVLWGVLTTNRKVAEFVREPAHVVEEVVAPKVSAEELIDWKAKYNGKIDELKDEVLRELKHCESHTSTEADAVINPHDGGSPSFGLYQFKIKTVQHYVKLFEGKEISKYDALLIAMSEEQSRKLAKTIIFDEVGGIWNWKNCAEKHQLAPQIEFIRKLEA